MLGQQYLFYYLDLTNFYFLKSSLCNRTSCKLKTCCWWSLENFLQVIDACKMVIPKLWKMVMGGSDLLAARKLWSHVLF